MTCKKVEIVNKLYLDFKFVRHVIRLLELLLQIFKLSLVVPVVGDGRPGNDRVGYPRILPLGLTRVVINEENATVRVNPLLPALRQRPQVILDPPIGHVG